MQLRSGQRVWLLPLDIARRDTRTFTISEHAERYFGTQVTIDRLDMDDNSFQIEGSAHWLQQSWIDLSRTLSPPHRFMPLPPAYSVVDTDLIRVGYRVRLKTLDQIFREGDLNERNISNEMHRFFGLNHIVRGVDNSDETFTIEGSTHWFNFSFVQEVQDWGDPYALAQPVVSRFSAGDIQVHEPPRTAYDRLTAHQQQLMQQWTVQPAPTPELEPRPVVRLRSGLLTALDPETNSSIFPRWMPTNQPRTTQEIPVTNRIRSLFLQPQGTHLNSLISSREQTKSQLASLANDLRRYQEATRELYVNLQVSNNRKEELDNLIKALESVPDDSMAAKLAIFESFGSDKFNKFLESIGFIWVGCGLVNGDGTFQIRVLKKGGIYFNQLPVAPVVYIFNFRRRSEGYTLHSVDTMPLLSMAGDDHIFHPHIMSNVCLGNYSDKLMAHNIPLDLTGFEDQIVLFNMLLNTYNTGSPYRRTDQIFTDLKLHGYGSFNPDQINYDISGERSWATKRMSTPAPYTALQKRLCLEFLGNLSDLNALMSPKEHMLEWSIANLSTEEIDSDDREYIMRKVEDYVRRSVIDDSLVPKAGDFVGDGDNDGIYWTTHSSYCDYFEAVKEYLFNLEDKDLKQYDGSTIPLSDSVKWALGMEITPTLTQEALEDEAEEEMVYDEDDEFEDHVEDYGYRVEDYENSTDN